MASPQCEDGYTRIANELLEAISKKRIPGQELRIVLTVIRKTYGFSKKSDQISYGQIAKATGIPRTRVIMHIKSLVSKKVLGSLNNGTRQPSTIWINKDYSQWVDSPTKETGPKEETRVVPKKRLEPSLMIGVPQKKKNKETLQKKKTYTPKFKEFIVAFGDNRGQKPAYEKSWCKIPDLTDELCEKIIEGAKRYAVERQNILARGGTPKMAQGWLTDRRWEDEIIPQLPKPLTEAEKKAQLFQAYLQDEAQQNEEPCSGPHEVIDIESGAETANPAIGALPWKRSDD